MSRKRDGSPISFSLRDRRVQLITALCLLLLLLLILIVLKLPEHFSPTGASSDGVDLLRPKISLDLPKDAVEKLYLFSDRLLFLGKENLTLEDYQGREQLAIQLDFQQPVAIPCRGSMVVGDRRSPRVLVLHRDGLAFETLLDGALAGAAADASGQHWALIDELSKGNPLVHILGKEGQRICSLSFEQSGSPLALDFSPDGKYLDILILNSAGSELKNLIKRYDLQGTVVAQKFVEGQADLFAGLTHDSQNRPTVFSSRRLLVYDFDSTQAVLEADFSDIARVFPHGGGVTVFASRRQDGLLSIFELGTKGEETERMSGLSANLSAVQMKGRIAFSNGAGLRLYDQISGSVSEEKFLDTDITQMSGISERELALAGGRGVRWLVLP